MFALLLALAAAPQAGTPGSRSVCLPDLPTRIAGQRDAPPVQPRHTLRDFYIPVQSPSPPPASGFRKLGELPDANEIRAVLRMVDGCPMVEVIHFHVSTPGGYVPGGVLVPDAQRQVVTGW
jgi:hypothetical protein